jgi:hypothetical protein
MMVWSRSSPTVAQRIERRSSVVSVVNDRCGTRTGSLGGGGSGGERCGTLAGMSLPTSQAGSPIAPSVHIRGALGMLLQLQLLLHHESPHVILDK